MLALAHAWRRTGDTKWLRWLDRMDDYSWRTFVDDPGAPSKAVPGAPSGEWFGYTDRSGRITHNAKGNHYKGFFHVPRALWLAVGELRAG
jgi:N-acylglucosamine 2-epimerase